MPFCGLLRPRRPRPLPTAMPRRSPFRNKLLQSPRPPSSLELQNSAHLQRQFQNGAFPSDAKFVPNCSQDCWFPLNALKIAEDAELLPVTIDESLDSEDKHGKSGADARLGTEFEETSTDRAASDPTMAYIASAQPKSVDASMERRWFFTLDRTMLPVVARAAIVAASQACFLVGRVGATMTMAMACSVLQEIRHARDNSSAKVTPLPQALGTSDALPEAEMFPQSPKTQVRIATNQASDHSASSSPRLRCVDSPMSMSSPDSSKCNSEFKIKGQKDATDRKISRMNRHHHVSRTVQFSEEKFAVKSLPDLCAQKPVLRAQQQLQQKSSNLGSLLATVGLCVGLVGFSVGPVSSIVAVVCWWYVIPYIKRMAGEKSTIVRVHHGDTGNDDKANVCKELRPWNYKKRVIMEGILERDRRPTG